MTDRPIFVVGAQRSGTTLVRLLLDAHPALCIGPETLFLKHIADGAARATGAGRPRQDDFGVPRGDIESELAAAWARVFARQAASREAVRWGDKSPVHRYHGARIRRLFPRAQVIAVVRHPAAVAQSRARWGHEEDRTLRDWGSTIRHHVADARRFGVRQFHLVRYEDLLADPRTTLSRLLTFLHEPWDDRVLDHTSNVEEGAVTDGGTVVSDPLDPVRATAWTRDVRPEDLARLPECVGDEMTLLGYAADLDTPVRALPDNDLTAPPPPPDPVRALRRVLADRGARVVARRALDEVRQRGVRGAVQRWRRL